MIQPRKSADRGHFDHGWLDTYHSFSFADYQDPKHMGFRSLRVINEDRVAPSQGFGTHPHRDMEIVTYGLSGALQHRDSMGNGSVIRAGDVQYMSAGNGVTHSEFNPSDSESVHLLQIWIRPSEAGAVPRYGQKSFPRDEKLSVFRPVVSPDGSQGSIAIRQDAWIFAAVLPEGKEVVHPFAKGRHGWLQVARGSVSLNGHPLQDGDGAALTGEAHATVRGLAPESEVLLFDLA